GSNASELRLRNECPSARISRFCGEPRPIVAGFSKIPQRTDGYVYVDKIALIYNLMSKGINNSPMEPRKTIDSFVAKC
ncbi:MAG: hypothetical protein PUD94_06805, partial [Prevotellaceae bacterium]|nr:hypothetical protein [Prevotellaceae bacterium]